MDEVIHNVLGSNSSPSTLLSSHSLNNLYLIKYVILFSFQILIPKKVCDCKAGLQCLSGNPVSHIYVFHRPTRNSKVRRVTLLYLRYIFCLFLNHIFSFYNFFFLLFMYITMIHFFLQTNQTTLRHFMR